MNPDAWGANPTHRADEYQRLVDAETTRINCTLPATVPDPTFPSESPIGFPARAGDHVPVLDHHADHRADPGPGPSRDRFGGISDSLAEPSAGPADPDRHADANANADADADANADADADPNANADADADA